MSKTNMLKAAREELRKCKSNIGVQEKTVACQQAAEKAWAHVHRTARIALGVSGKDAQKIVKVALAEMSIREPKKAVLSTEYSAIQDQLHGDCFYDELPFTCTPEYVDPRVDIAERLAERLKKDLPRYRYVVKQAQKEFAE